MSIRMRSRRGRIGTSWQARALRESLEGVLGSSRASGGRRLARADRVQWLDVAPRRARAGVLDDDGRIHEPELDVAAFGAADRAIVIEALLAHPELPARMSAGVYPQEIEEELDGHDATLLPRSVSELSHDCTCMDWPGPCVHVAALAYVLVEAVDEAPVHLLTLRALTLSEITAPVASGRGSRALAQAAEQSPSAAQSPSAERPSTAPPDAADEAEGDEATDIDTERPPEAGGPAPGGRAEFDPSIADPTLLREALGVEAAEAIARFFGSGRESGPTR